MEDFRDEYVGFLRCLGLRTTCLVIVLSAVLFALVVGGLLATGLLMMYNDTDLLNKNKMMKKGKKFVKKMGII